MMRRVLSSRLPCPAPPPHRFRIVPSAPRMSGEMYWKGDNGASPEIRVDRGVVYLFMERHCIVQRLGKIAHTVTRTKSSFTSSSQQSLTPRTCSHVESTPQNTKSCDRLAPLRGMLWIWSPRYASQVNCHAHAATQKVGDIRGYHTQGKTY